MTLIDIARLFAPALGLLALSVWVWKWNPHPGRGLSLFPAAHIPGYSKVLSLILGAAALAWIGFGLVSVSNF